MYNYNNQQHPQYNYQQNPPGPSQPSWPAPPRRSGGWADPRLQGLGGNASPSPSLPGFAPNVYGTHGLPGPPPPPPPLPPPPPSSGRYSQQAPSNQSFDTSQWGVNYTQAQQNLSVEQAPPLPPRPVSSAGHHESRPQEAGYSNTPWQQTGSSQQGAYYQYDPHSQWSQPQPPSQDFQVPPPPPPPPRPLEYQNQQMYTQQPQTDQHGSSQHPDPFMHDPYSHHRPNHHYEPANPPSQQSYTSWADQVPQRAPSTQSESRMAHARIPSVSIGQHGHSYSHHDAAPVSPIDPNSEHKLHASALGSGGNPSDWEMYAPEPNDSKPDRAPSPHIELPSATPTQSQHSYSPQQTFVNANSSPQEKPRSESVSTLPDQAQYKNQGLLPNSPPSSPPTRGQKLEPQDRQHSDGPIQTVKRADTIDGVIDAWNSPLRTNESEQEPQRSSSTAKRHKIAGPHDDVPGIVGSAEDRFTSWDTPVRSQSTTVNKVVDSYEDLEPEYRASLKRFAAMLRREAAIEEDEEKFKMFQSFVTKELRMRSILYGVEMPELVPQQDYRHMQEQTPPPVPQPSVVPYEVVQATKPPSPPPPVPPPTLDQLVRNSQPNHVAPKDSPLDHAQPVHTQQLSTPVPSIPVQHSQTPDIPRGTPTASQGTTEELSISTKQSLAQTGLQHVSSLKSDETRPTLPTSNGQQQALLTPQMPQTPLGPQVPKTTPQPPPEPTHLPSPAVTAKPSMSSTAPTTLAETQTPSNAVKSPHQPPRPLTPPKLMTDTVKQTESPKLRDDFVVVDAHQDGEDDVDYSPGGRPRLLQSRRQDGPSQAKNSTHSRPPTLEQGPPSPGANAPMVIEDYVTVEPTSPPRHVPIIVNKVNTDAKPIDFQPPRPVYTPFRYSEDGQSPQPPAVASKKSADEAYSSLRKEAIDSNRLLAIDPPQAVTPTGGRKEHEEAFIGLIRSQSKLVRKKNSGVFGLDALRVGTPAVRSESALKKATVALRSMLPPSDTALSAVDHPNIAAMKSKLEQVPDQFGFIHESVVSWDRGNREIRRKLDEERRLRQEDSEAHIDGLFHDNEIGYADIGIMEEEFKLAEAERKYREDQDELESFIQKVYNPVTERLERDIGEITAQYTLAVDMLDLNSDPLSSFSTATNDRVQMTSIMETVLQIYHKLEIRHQKVAEAHYECERRRKRVELTVLYTNGDTAGVKKLEQEFQVAEKMQILHDARNKDTRANKLMDLFDRAVARGLGDNQTFLDEILAKTKSLNETLQRKKDQISPTELFAPDGPRETLGLAKSISNATVSDSRRLLAISNRAEIILNDADYAVSVAEARVARADEKTYAKLEAEKAREDAKIVEELESRLSSVSKTPEEISALIDDVVARVGHDPDHKERIKKSLEAAKMRNAGKDGGGGGSGGGTGVE